MSNRPVKVMHILPILADDGPSRVVIDLCRHLERAKYDLSICSLSNPYSGVAQNLEQQLGLHCIGLGVDRVWDMITLWMIVKAIKEIRPDIVHTHVLRPDWYGRIAARICHVPVICSTVHNEDDVCYRSDYKCPPVIVHLIDRINRMTARYAQVLVAVSEGVRTYLVQRQGIAKEKIQVIPNGVDLRQYGGERASAAYLRKACDFNKDSLVVGTVAALKQQKGLQYLISAAAQVVNEHPKARFVLVGTGTMESTVRDWIKQAGLEQVFIMTGQRGDVPQLLTGMDLFVLPSLWEGMPMALLEAMSMGRACVVTDIGGPNELVEDGRSGVIVPPGDSEALAKAILRLLRDTALRVALGQAARLRVETVYSVEAVARAYDGLYQKLLHSALTEQV